LLRCGRTAAPADPRRLIPSKTLAYVGYREDEQTTPLNIQLSCDIVGEGRRSVRWSIDYAWKRAAEFGARAEEASDPDLREFFVRLRDSWISTANRYELIEAIDERQSVDGHIHSMAAPPSHDSTKDELRPPSGPIASSAASRIAE